MFQRESTGSPILRLGVLFERILKQRRASGLFSRFHERSSAPPEEHCLAGSGRLFPGLIRYYESTGDTAALDAATGLAVATPGLSESRGARTSKEPAAVSSRPWASEPFARLYAIDHDPRWLQFCGMILSTLARATCPATPTSS